LLITLLGLIALPDAVLRFALLCLRALLPPRPTMLARGGGQAIILIAARDEEGTIGPTVAALRSQLGEWPGSRLWVVADHCRDATATEAEAAGARVARRAEGKMGKGAVIDWFLSRHPDEWRARPVLLVLDADSRLAPGSLSALKRELIDGVAAAQAFVAPEAETSAGRLAGWSEVLMQRIDDEARRRAGWSVPLRGTGMAFRAELLAELAPRLRTLAEDLELDILLSARGERVRFVPAARVLDPKPRLDAGVSRQRARWLQGQLQVARHYPREIWRALKRGPAAWMLILPLLLRPKIAFLGLRLLLLMTGLVAGSAAVAAIGAAGLLLDAAYYLAGAALVENPRQYLLDLLGSPRYAALWLYSFGVAAIRRGWLRAGR
jgi:cellulose synthase/poly-beta-1,6-N-acetylglucosamine synthase-like glycosyltransferase